MEIEQALQKVLGFGVSDFVKKAIEGGWKSSRYPKYTTERLKHVSEFWASIETTERTFSEEENKEVPVTFTVPPETILLDPLAWKAAGKVEGGRKESGGLFMEVQYLGDQEFQWNWDWKLAMHRFIDALSETP